jgi:hypothetical protein
MSTPEQMRAAVAHYVEEIHRACWSPELSLPMRQRPMQQWKEG